MGFTDYLPSMPDLSEVWIKPSIGLWFGAGAANGDDEGGEGGMVLGGYEISFGLLLGSLLGFGDDWGLYTGLMGAFALIPFLGLGFIGVPLGVHWKKRLGIGLIIPIPLPLESIPLPSWSIGLLAGLVLFFIGYKIAGETF